MTEDLSQALATSLATALDPALLMRRAGLTPDQWQRDVLRSTSSRVLLLCSRQAGKSTTSAAMALYEALYRAPALVLLLSPSLRQSTELFRTVAATYRALGAPVAPEQESTLRLELANGSRIISLPGTEQNVRGFAGVRLLVIDESARVDDSLYFSVRPMLAVSGGRIVALGTPFGKRGWFYQEWTQGAGWERTRITATQCPRITQAFLGEERASLGDWWFRQEYGCEFLETSDQVFGLDLVHAAITDEVEPL